MLGLMLMLSRRDRPLSGLTDATGPGGTRWALGFATAAGARLITLCASNLVISSIPAFDGVNTV